MAIESTSDAVAETPKEDSGNKKILARNLGLVDSSDEDEDADTYLNRKYSEYGNEIRQHMRKFQEEKDDRKLEVEVRKATANECRPTPKVEPAAPVETFNPVNQALVPKHNDSNVLGTCFTDPVFGMKIIRPLVSSTLLKARMAEKRAVSSTHIRNFVDQIDKSVDWVIAGAIITKSPVKTTKTGSQYSIWQISDLRGGDVKTVSLFLFKNAHKDLWKTAQGLIVAVLNPSPMERRPNSKDEATVCVDTAQKVMILGQSKDLGHCKSKKKNGDTCGALVNLSTCEYCIYHVKKEFSAVSQRAGLQSSTAGRGLNDLRNKVLGKNEVFYGGQSYTAVPAVKNPKLIKKDQERLLKLSEYYGTTTSAAARVPKQQRVRVAASVELNVRDRAKDLERLKMLKRLAQENEKNVVNLPQSAVKSSISPAVLSTVPRLSGGDFTFEIKGKPLRSDLSKLKALEVLKKNPIKKSDPNFIKYRGTESGKKRLLDELDTSVQEPTEIKRQKRADEEQKTKEESRKSRIQRIMEANSSHTNLVESKERDAQEVYFNTLERKEAMEEKMIGTYKMACKAVACMKCKYIAFKASDLCKADRHPLKLMEAEKRFFKCADCGNRTVSLHRLPKETCSNCKSSRWVRTGMMKEKTVTLSTEKLSIRGDEEMYIGGASSKNINLDLHVAED